NEAALPIYAGGSISDIRYRNIRVESLQQNLIYMITQWNDYYAGQKNGSIKNVTFEGLSCLDAGWISLNPPSGGPPIQGLFFKRVKIPNPPRQKTARLQIRERRRGEHRAFPGAPAPGGAGQCTHSARSQHSPRHAGGGFEQRTNQADFHST